ncbi:MAG: homoserine kinase [Anaerolineae bacterium]|nr:homoserine kinase [Anaerolineae bacterium]
MPITRAEAFAPASMGNVGIGFDILGLAYQEPGDRVIAEYWDQPGIQIAKIEGDGGRLPLTASQNTAGVAAQSVLSRVGADCGISLTIYKGLSLESGMGSSAASAVAAAMAVNALLGSPLTKRDLLPACLDGEALVSGRHADNVAPCLLGGIVLVTGVDADHILTLPYPAQLRLALVTPEVAVPTAQARAVLPPTIPLKAMVSQTMHVARMIDALYRGDLEAIAMAMESDQVIEPARAHLMPYLQEVRSAAKAAGALGVVISGAGPTLCAVCDSDTSAERVAFVMGSVYQAAGMGATVRATQICDQGARVI